MRLARAGGRAERRRLLCFLRADCPAGKGEARAGREPAGATSAWGHRRVGSLASARAPAPRCPGAVLARIAG